MAKKQKYDYVIIGSGASGAVIANRLSGSGASVLVLEAGGEDDDPNIAALGGFTALWGSEMDWQLMTEVQPGMADRELMINQGKVVGGSTSINAMMYVRGNPGNFDMWNALGADGWSYADVLPYFIKLEDYEGGASEYHGVGGDLRIRDCPDDVMRSEPFLKGAVEVGYDGPYWDYNGERQENGAGLLQFHVGDEGQRASAATAFLDPMADRKNLTVTLGAHVTKIVVDKGRATGVEYVKDGKNQTAQRCQRGDRQCRRLAFAPVAAALRHRTGRRTGRTWHRRGRRPARRGPESAGSRAVAGHLPLQGRHGP